MKTTYITGISAIAIAASAVVMNHRPFGGFGFEQDGGSDLYLGPADSDNGGGLSMQNTAAGGFDPIPGPADLGGSAKFALNTKPEIDDITGEPFTGTAAATVEIKTGDGHMSQAELDHLEANSIAAGQAEFDDGTQHVTDRGE
jgi:hypothetical protein